ATGEREDAQCSWKLDSSTAITSYGSGWRTASRIGVPTLPALQDRRPAARSTAVSICTVVVLPLVPVMVSQGAAPTARRRHASSTSPQMSMPWPAASASSGWSGRQPGEVTTRSIGSRGIPPTCSGPTRTSTPRMSRMRIRSISAELPAGSAPSTRITLAPRSTRASAAAKPLTPPPVTRMRRPLGSKGSAWSGWTSVRPAGLPTTDDPLRVEQSQPEGDEESGQDPEADDDRHLCPAQELEVVLERRHPEDAFAGGLEGGDLDDHRERDHDEETAEDDDEQLGAGRDGQAGHRTTERQRAGVTH